MNATRPTPLPAESPRPLCGQKRVRMDRKSQAHPPGSPSASTNGDQKVRPGRPTPGKSAKSITIVSGRCGASRPFTALRLLVLASLADGAAILDVVRAQCRLPGPVDHTG